MDWMVELPDGALFGPIPLGALADLIDDGTITADAKLRNRHTGETTTVARREKDILKPADGAPATQPSPADAAAAKAARAQSEAIARRVATLEDQAKAAQRDLDETRRKSREEAERYAQFRKQTQTQSDTYQKQIPALEQQRAQLAEALEKARTDLKARRPAAAARDIDWIDPEKSSPTAPSTGAEAEATAGLRSELTHARAQLKELDGLREALKQAGEQLAQARREQESHAAAARESQQKAAAREYELHQELDALRKASGATADALKQAREALRQQADGDESAALRQRVAELESRAAAQARQLAQAEQERESRQGEVETLKSRAEANAADFSQKIETLRQEVEAAAARLKQTEESLEQEQAARAEANARLKQAEEALKRDRDGHAGAASELRRRESDLKRRLDETTHTLAARERDLAQLRDQLTQRARELEHQQRLAVEKERNLLQRVTELRTQAETLEGELEAAAQALAEQRGTPLPSASPESLQAEAAQLESTGQEQAQRIDEAETKLAGLADELARLGKDHQDGLDRLHKELEQLRSHSEAADRQLEQAKAALDALTPAQGLEAENDAP